mgnify:CR=1 FL=1
MLIGSSRYTAPAYRNNPLIPVNVALRVGPRRLSLYHRCRQAGRAVAVSIRIFRIGREESPGTTRQDAR